MLVVAMLATACRGDAEGEGGAGGPAAPGPSRPSSTTVVNADVPRVDDWLASDLSLALGGGIALTHCDGDAPVLCFSRDGGERGILELSSFPIASLDAVRGAQAKGARAALEAHVAEYLASLRDDRVAGCGDGYVVTALPTTFTEGPAGPVASYGFAGARRGEAVSERTVQWAALRGENLVLLNLSGYDDGSCVPAEGEGSVADAVAVEVRLRPVVEANPLPMEVGPSA